MRPAAAAAVLRGRLRGQPQIGPGVRVAVLNAMGGRDQVKFIALLVQGIPRSMKVDDHLQRASAELAPLELDAVQFGEAVVKIPTDRPAWKPATPA